MNFAELENIMEQYGVRLAGIGAIFLGLLFSWVVLAVGIRWAIFRKAGHGGWKALIPFYSDYTYFKIAWSGKVYVIVLLCAIIGMMSGAFATGLHREIGLVVTLAWALSVFGAYAIISMILQFRMAHAFGRNDYFAVGLYLLNGLFTAILAFGNARYRGPQKKTPVEIEKTMNSTEPEPIPSAHSVQNFESRAVGTPSCRETPHTQSEYTYQPRVQYQPAAQVRRTERSAEAE